MANAVHPAAVGDGAAHDAPAHRTRHHATGHAQPQGSFQQAVLRAAQSKGAAGHLAGPVHRAAAHVVAPAKHAAAPPAASLQALEQAMAKEGVPASWQPSLAFIMAQESGGQVGAHSPIHSARGLYQLTAANYHHNPNGAASFGNAVEEAQGGIRYIRARYGTADNAAAFWRRHRWY